MPDAALADLSAAPRATAEPAQGAVGSGGNGRAPSRAFVKT
jgi:hypothetical protein